MKHFYDGDLNANARALRRDMTPWERKLWHLFLKAYPVKVYRQRIMGPYIVDFYCAKAKLAIELDGSQHFTPEAMERDAARSAYLSRQGITLLRFPNIDIDRRFPSVCEAIDLEIKRRIP